MGLSGRQVAGLSLALFDRKNDLAPQTCGQAVVGVGQFQTSAESTAGGVDHSIDDLWLSRIWLASGASGIIRKN